MLRFAFLFPVLFSFLEEIAVFFEGFDDVFFSDVVADRFDDAFFCDDLEVLFDLAERFDDVFVCDPFVCFLDDDDVCFFLDADDVCFLDAGLLVFSLLRFFGEQFSLTIRQPERFKSLCKFVADNSILFKIYIFHRSPHDVHVQNTVIASSALRVCCCLKLIEELLHRLQFKKLCSN